MSQIRVDIDQKLAGIALEQHQLRWEPLRIVIAAAVAGAALMRSAVGLPALLFRHFAS